MQFCNWNKIKQQERSGSRIRISLFKLRLHRFASADGSELMVMIRDLVIKMGVF